MCCNLNDDQAAKSAGPDFLYNYGKKCLLMYYESHMQIIIVPISKDRSTISEHPKLLDSSL